MPDTTYPAPLEALPLSDQIKQAVALITMRARQDMAQGKEVLMMYFIVNTAKDTIEIVVPVLSDADETDIVVADVRKRAATADADLVIAVSEGWRSPARTPEEAAKLQAKYGAVENMPGAVEVMLVRLENRDTCFAAVGNITGQGLDRRYGDLLYQEVLKAFDNSRIQQLVPPPGRLREIETAKALAEAKMRAVGIDPHDKLGPRSPLESLELKMWMYPDAPVGQVEIDQMVFTLLLILRKYAP